mgnify:CR=1 FL=1
MITKKKLEIMNDVSKKLHLECINDKCEAIDPVNWIYNQDKMRDAWEKFKLDFNNKPEFIKNIMLQNSFGRYMGFMYDNYPPGYGNEFKNCINKNIPIDGLKIYNELINQ